MMVDRVSRIGTVMKVMKELELVNKSPGSPIRPVVWTIIPPRHDIRGELKG